MTFFIYNLFLIIFSPVLILFYFFYSIYKKKSFYHHIKRVFIRYEELPETPKRILINAVSVGELLSISPLIEKLKEKNYKIVLSTTTKTGFEIAEKKYKKFVEKIILFPIDFSWNVKNLVSRIKPALFISVEAEFWLNLFNELNKKSIPIFVINLRVEKENSYKLFKPYYRKVFSFVEKFFIPHKKYKRFLNEFSVDDSRIVLTGNLKADISIKKLNNEEIQELLSEVRLRGDDKIFVAGSTKKGEEKLFLPLISKFKNEWKFVFAPRNINRSNEVFKFFSKRGFKVSLRTKPVSSYDILIVDTIGELLYFYYSSLISFVGGSLIRGGGGHNILEPISVSTLTSTGPYHKNFKELIDELKEKKAILIIKSPEELEPFFRMDREKLQKLGENSQKALLSMRGASDKIIHEIDKILKTDVDNPF